MRRKELSYQGKSSSSHSNDESLVMSVVKEKMISICSYGRIEWLELIYSLLIIDRMMRIIIMSLIIKQGTLIASCRDNDLETYLNNDRASSFALDTVVVVVTTVGSSNDWMDLSWDGTVLKLLCRTMITRDDKGMMEDQRECRMIDWSMFSSHFQQLSTRVMTRLTLGEWGKWHDQRLIELPILPSTFIEWDG